MYATQSTAPTNKVHRHNIALHNPLCIITYSNPRFSNEARQYIIPTKKINSEWELTGEIWRHSRNKDCQFSGIWQLKTLPRHKTKAGQKIWSEVVRGLTQKTYSRCNRLAIMSSKWNMCFRFGGRHNGFCASGLTSGMSASRWVTHKPRATGLKSVRL